MADQPTITQADVDSLGQKLTQFKQTLTEGEVAAMAAVFQSGIPQAEDVKGYGYSFSGYGAGGVAPGPGTSIPSPGPLIGIFPTHEGKTHQQ